MNNDYVVRVGENDFIISDILETGPIEQALRLHSRAARDLANRAVASNDFDDVVVDTFSDIL